MVDDAQRSHEVAPPIYVAIDVETDGPDPYRHSMLSIGAVAADDLGRELSTWTANLRSLGDRLPDRPTMDWWATQPAAWTAIRERTVAPATAVAGMLAWLEALPYRPVLVAHPLAFDAAWIDAYLRAFSDRVVFDVGPSSTSPFDGAGIDVATYVRAALGLPYGTRPPHYPPALQGGLPHSHVPVDDARGHLAKFFNARRIAEDPVERARLRAEMSPSRTAPT